ncbi:MAG: hypothetical protein HC817_01805 [Saprospiraceae bacterium]|nr:hypothetical protein [Saprospiraceae bacterium]
MAWYAWAIPTWGGNGIVKGIFDNQIDWVESRKILEYHWRVIFPETLLNRAAVGFFILGFFALILRGRLFKLGAFEVAFGSLFVVFYLLYELNMIHIIHDYYMMPFLPHLFSRRWIWHQTIAF